MNLLARPPRTAPLRSLRRSHMDGTSRSQMNGTRLSQIGGTPHLLVRVLCPDLTPDEAAEAVIPQHQEQEDGSTRQPPRNLDTQPAHRGDDVPMPVYSICATIST